MIPILYDANETEYLTNGLGRLSSAVSVVATEDSSGYDEIAVKYPITGEHYNDIDLDKIILVKPAQNRRTQPYFIYNISRPLNGIVTINARHISYKLAGMVVMPYSADSCYAALTSIPDHTVETCPFTFDTDKAVTGPFEITEPTPVRTLLGGSAGSILDVYGKGQYEFDRFSVYLHVNRGQDRGVTLRYGKNITDLTRKSDTSSVYVGIVPYWADGQGTLVTLPEEVIYSPAAQMAVYKTIKVVDLSDQFQEQPTVNQLRQRAQTYLENNEGWEIADNITVSFAALWQTEEYKDVEPLQAVGMGDTVTVIDTRLGVKASAKVIKTVYDVINERYDRIELGTAKNSLAQVIGESSLVRTIEPWVNQRFEVENGRFLSMIEQVVEEISEEVDLTYEDELTNSARLHATPPAVENLAYLDTTPDGEPCLIVDGTTVETYTNTNRAFLALISDRAIPPINVTIEFDLIAEYETAPDPTNLLCAFWYAREDTGQTWWHTYAYSTLEGGVPASGQKVHVKKEITNKRASASTGTYLVFLFSPGVKLTVTNVQVYDDRDDYLGTVSSYINQTASEIELSVQELAIHQYIDPFIYTDTTTDYSWRYHTGFTEDGYVLTTGEHNGHQCLIIDGTNVTDPTGPWNAQLYRRINYGGSAGSQVPFKFTIESSIDIAATSTWYVAAMSFPTSQNGSTSYPYSMPAMTANTPKTLTLPFTVPSSVYYGGVSTSSAVLFGYPGAIIYIYDGSIQTTEQDFAESTFTMSTSGISTKVARNGVISAINQSAEQVQIQANKIDLVGAVYVTDDENDPLLKVYWEDPDEEGSTTINGGSIVLVNDDVSLSKDRYAYLGNGELQLANYNLADPTGLSGETRWWLSLSGDLIQLWERDFTDNDGSYTETKWFDTNFSDPRLPTFKFRGNSYLINGADPISNYNWSLGGSNCWYNVPVHFLKAVYNSGGGVQFTSDRRKKNTIKDLAKKAAKKFIMALRPRSFKYNEGESGRLHHGFIAQELHDAMEGRDWGVWCEDKDGDREQSIRPDEIIADLVSVVQQHEEEIAVLREKLQAMEGDGK